VLLRNAWNLSFAAVTVACAMLRLVLARTQRNVSSKRKHGFMFVDMALQFTLCVYYDDNGERRDVIRTSLFWRIAAEALCVVEASARECVEYCVKSLSAVMYLW
jgi:hypothetical protein